MAQFTVYRNRNQKTKATFPLLLNVQSDLLEDLDTRVVIPMTRAATLAAQPLAHLMPSIEVERERYLLLTQQLAGIPKSALGPAVADLVPHRTTIIAALDFLLTGV